MTTEFKYLGYPMSYWMELQVQAENLHVTNLLVEISKLRSKVSYYEDRIKEMKRFMEITYASTY